MSWTVAEELAKVRETFSAREIVTCSPQIVQCALASSAYRRDGARGSESRAFPPRLPRPPARAPPVSHGEVDSASDSSFPSAPPPSPMRQPRIATPERRVKHRA